jgi:hypothetical protein
MTGALHAAVLGGKRDSGQHTRSVLNDLEMFQLAQTGVL